MRPDDVCAECSHRRDEHVGKLCVGQRPHGFPLVFELVQAPRKGCLCRAFVDEHPDIKNVRRELA